MPTTFVVCRRFDHDLHDTSLVVDLRKAHQQATKLYSVNRPLFREFDPLYVAMQPRDSVDSRIWLLQCGMQKSDNTLESH